jgi:glucuronosyltransferase
LLSSTVHPQREAVRDHVDLLSIQEAIHRGVSVVGIPILGDQKHNINEAVSFGFGVKRDFVNLSTEYVTRALKEEFENPR